MENDFSHIQWWHSIDLGDRWTPGQKSREMLEAEANLIFQKGIAGKTVLDIGAWDGFFSFEAERRSASRVLATDHFCWSGPGWGTREGFDYAHRCRQSKVEARDIDLPDLKPATVGVWDVVLFLGVLYHVKDPYSALEAVAKLAKETLIVETVTALNDFPEAVARFYYLDELNKDPTNFWAPNTKCLEAMLLEIGFPRVEIVQNPTVAHNRHVAFAQR
jgi:tRNA (mo5U34)-methyltransferase